jgi:hypothetical protein
MLIGLSEPKWGVRSVYPCPVAPVIQLSANAMHFTLLGIFIMRLQNWLAVPQLCMCGRGGHPCHRAVTRLHMVPLCSRHRVCTVNMRLTENRLSVHFCALHWLMLLSHSCSTDKSFWIDEWITGTKRGCSQIILWRNYVVCRFSKDTSFDTSLHNDIHKPRYKNNRAYINDKVVPAIH